MNFSENSNDFFDFNERKIIQKLENFSQKFDSKTLQKIQTSREKSHIAREHHI